MKTVFRRSFERDLRKTKERSILNRVKRVIEEVEAAGSHIVTHISNRRPVG